jgi:hypothetical protein
MKPARQIDTGTDELLCEISDAWRRSRPIGLKREIRFRII